MSIRVSFEIGHSAAVKGKTTVEGFTHDWELFVRGGDSNNISRFVDKVVFILHDSFPKPKRAIKEPPYVLKECGYAGFELDIDIYLKCQRDEQKKITFRYDLTLPNKGSTSASEKRFHTFVTPSSEFRRKLLDGGGIIINPSILSNDDRSRDAIDDRTQLLSKPKLGLCSSSGVGVGSGDTKKHKIKSSQDDVVMKPSSTFANLFGTPFTKLSNSKQSPEQKISNNINSSNNTKLPSSSSVGSSVPAVPSALVSSGNNCKQVSQKSSTSSSLKDKSDKSSKSKKEKNKLSSSPVKDGRESMSSKKTTASLNAADDKHQRRDDVRKEKSYNKDRERNKDKPSKRPSSPKPLATSRSPKSSASPFPRNISSNRHLTDGTATSTASQSILSARHASDEKASSTSTNKKSKKEKRDKSFEKDRERDIDAKRDAKSMSTSSKQTKDDKPLSKSLEKINGTSKKDRDGGGGSGNNTPKDSMRDKSSSNSNAKYRQVFDAKNDSPVEAIQKSVAASSGMDRENKKVDKYDGSDRKHKHKKKDKKEKGRSGSKDCKKDKEKMMKASGKDMIDENSTSSATNHKRSYGQTPPLHGMQSVSSAKVATSSAGQRGVTTTHSKLSDDSSSDFEIDDDYPMTRSARPLSPLAVKHEKLDIVDSIASEQRNNIGLPDAITKLSPLHRVLKVESPTKQTKKSVKESKSNSLIAASKEEKKRKRKNKNEKPKHDSDSNSSSSKRKTHSPANIEPPAKMIKKEELMSKAVGQIIESSRDGLNQTPPIGTTHHHHHHQQQQQQLQPQQPQNIHNQHQQIQSDSITSNSSISLPNLSTDSSFRSPGEPTPVDYISQLRALQQKIMALQDNSELQQVVEMIAATGCYEITSRTFDFDLCALDRTTVQRLQDFFSQSQSAVL